MKNEFMFNILFREKPAMMLVSINKSGSEIYASSLAKQVDCTYSHVVKILQQMEKNDLVNFEKRGRLKVLTLTKKGKEVAENIDKIANLL
jgi:DNA-binding MarR family transcriptional regulator